MNKKTTFFLGIFIFALFVGGSLWFAKERIVEVLFESKLSGQKADTSIKDSVKEDKKYRDPKTFTELSDILFRLDQYGYSTSREPNMRISKIQVATGTEIVFGLNVSKEKKINPALVKVTLIDTNGTRVLTDIKVEDMGYGLDYVVKYTPEKSGKGTISVEVMGTLYKGLLEVSAFDRSLLGEVNVSEKEFLRDERRLSRDTNLDWGNIATVKPQFKKLGDVPWQLDYPGYLSLPYSSEQTRTKGELKLYALASLEEYKDQTVIPSFYKHILSLSDYLKNENDPNPKDNHEVFKFPPVNAAMAGISHIKIVKSKNFDGVSYIYSGHFQAFDPATQPTYVYQGLSSDGKYFIYFEHELFSVALRSYLKKNNDCSPYRSQEKYQTCVEGSFVALERDYNLDPNTGNLNSFVESFDVRRQ